MVNDLPNSNAEYAMLYVMVTWYMYMYGLKRDSSKHQ